MAAKSGKPKAQQVSDRIEIDMAHTPVLYTDNINITTNKDGVMLNVIQRFGNTRQVVGRIGMSREHARDFVEKLGKLLIMTEDGKSAKKGLN